MSTPNIDEAVSAVPPARIRLERKHPLAIRWMHWINFPVLFTMIWSGLLIYWNDSDNAYQHPHRPYRIGIGRLTLFRFFPDWFYKVLHVPYHVTQGLGYHFFFMWVFALIASLWIPVFTTMDGPALKRSRIFARVAPPYSAAQPVVSHGELRGRGADSCVRTHRRFYDDSESSQANDKGISASDLWRTGPGLSGTRHHARKWHTAIARWLDSRQTRSASSACSRGYPIC